MSAFENENIQSLINSSIIIIESIDEPIESDAWLRNKKIVSMLRYIQTNHKTFDIRSEINDLTFREIELPLLHTIENRDSRVSNEHLNVLYGVLFLLFRSNDLVSGARPFVDSANDYDYAYNNRAKFNGDALNYLLKGFDIGFYATKKAMLPDGHMRVLKEFNDSISVASRYKLDMEQYLQSTENRAITLRNNLDNYKTTFTLIGLSLGFNDLKNEKELELKKSRCNLRIFGGLVALVPILEFFFGIKYFNNMQQILMSAISATSLLIILIYFFRINLANYKSILSQILQIKLRVTLCKFIKEYADFAKEIKEKDSESLSKFENIVFSGILADDSKIPATFDGLDTLASLIKSIRN